MEVSFRNHGKNLRKLYGVSSIFMIQYRLNLARLDPSVGVKFKRSSYQEISIEVILWLYFGERRNKRRLNQNVECRKMAPASRNLLLKL